MMGLFLLVVASLWLFAVAGLVVLVTRKLPARWWKAPLRLVLIVVLLPLPLIDEIVGGIQFRRLCEQHQTIYVAPNAKGRIAYLTVSPRTEVKGTWVPVRLQEFRYLDATTGETLVRYSTLFAGHGFFHLSDAPLTFKAWCEPNGEVDIERLLQEVGITQVQRSVTESGR